MSATVKVRECIECGEEREHTRSQWSQRGGKCAECFFVLPCRECGEPISFCSEVHPNGEYSSVLWKRVKKRSPSTGYAHVECREKLAAERRAALPNPMRECVSCGEVRKQSNILWSKRNGKCAECFLVLPCRHCGEDVSFHESAHESGAYDPQVWRSAKKYAAQYGAIHEGCRVHEKLGQLEERRQAGSRYSYHAGLSNKLAAEWSLAVRERDNHTCQSCGSQEDLEAHHIAPKELYPYLAAHVPNGITLCRPCHGSGGDDTGVHGSGEPINELVANLRAQL